MGCTDPLRRGVGAPHQCPLESVASYLCHIYTDVQLHIPMTHRADVGPVWMQGQLNASAGGAFDLPAEPIGDIPIHSRPTFDGAVSVHRSGAKGDGVTDDTKALQAAIDAHPTIFLPFGQYLVSDTIKLKPNTKIV